MRDRLLPLTVRACHAAALRAHDAQRRPQGSHPPALLRTGDFRKLTPGRTGAIRCLPALSATRPPLRGSAEPENLATFSDGVLKAVASGAGLARATSSAVSPLDALTLAGSTVPIDRAFGFVHDTVMLFRCSPRSIWQTSRYPSPVQRAAGSLNGRSQRGISAEASWN